MKPVRLYTTYACGYCHAAKQLLERRGIPFEEIDVTRDHETRVWLQGVTGQRTIPQILVGDEVIGGFTELHALDRSGELAAMLEDG